MPAPITPKDAVLNINATFREYTGPGSFCVYDIEPDDDKFRQTKPKWPIEGGKPIWRFGTASLHVGHYQKEYTTKDADPEKHIPTTIRLESDKARGRFRLNISVKGAPSNMYHPVGLVFLRADGTNAETGKRNNPPPDYPVGIPYTTQGSKKGNCPFENIEINGEESFVEFEMVRTHQVRPVEPPPRGKKGKEDVVSTHRTYRIWIVIQNTETGEIGIIDPEGEDPNTH